MSSPTSQSSDLDDSKQTTEQPLVVEWLHAALIQLPTNDPLLFLGEKLKEYPPVVSFAIWQTLDHREKQKRSLTEKITTRLHKHNSNKGNSSTDGKPSETQNEQPVIRILEFFGDSQAWLEDNARAIFENSTHTESTRRNGSRQPISSDFSITDDFIVISRYAPIINKRSWVSVVVPSKEADTTDLALLALLNEISAQSAKAEALKPQKSLENLTAVTHIISDLEQHDSLLSYCMALCNSAAETFSCENVSIGLLHDRKVKIKARSNVNRLKRHMQILQDLEMAMEECLDQAVITRWPRKSNDGTIIDRDIEKFSLSHGSVGILCVPVIYDNQAVAVISIEQTENEPLDDDQVLQLQLLAELIPGRLRVTQKAELHWVPRTVEAMNNGLSWLIGARHTGPKLVSAIILILLAYLFLVKTTYSIHATSQVVAIEQRVITAPYAGVLDAVYHDPGDIVSPHSGPLISFDPTEVELQAVAQKAEKARFLAQAGLAEAQGNPAEQQIALAQAERIQANIDLLATKIDRATINAPVAGIVISESLRLLIGTTIPEGQELMTVVPSDQLAIDLNVPEDQITDLAVGMTGECVLLARPDLTLPMTIERIQPAAVTGQGGNTFVVRARLHQVPEGLFPGMTGNGTIAIGPRSRWWIWTRPLRLWLIKQGW